MIPPIFCWTRFGTEAGQSIDHILKRKEQERQANDGLFFWGIGNAISPSIRELVRRTENPEVLFSPIKSAARVEDVSPASVVAWSSAETLSGEPYLLPRGSLVTSRYTPDSPRSAHYALACFSKDPLRITKAEQHVSFGELRNLLTGRPIGASQVTSVVQRTSETTPSAKSYGIAIRARLVAPFLIRLSDPVALQDCTISSERESAWNRVVSENWCRRIAERGSQLALGHNLGAFASSVPSFHSEQQ